MIASSVQKVTESLASACGCSKSAAREMSVSATVFALFIDPIGGAVTLSSMLAEDQRKQRGNSRGPQSQQQ